MSRSGILLCYPFDERRLRNQIRRQTPWTPPFLIQPKLDGERCRAFVNANGSVTLLSSELHEIKSVPHINEAIEKLKLFPGLELDGELYQHGTDFSEIHSRVGRTATLHLDYESMEYHIFDIIDQVAPQLERLQYLNRLPLKPPLFKVQTDVASDPDEVLTWLETFVDRGYEGIIIREAHAPYVRKRSTQVMKFKPKKSDYYPIVDFVEEVSKLGEPKNALGALVLTSDEGTVFNVGSGFTRDQRNELWQTRFELVGKICKISYQNLTEKHIPRFPVFTEILDPMKGGDLFEA